MKRILARTRFKGAWANSPRKFGRAIKDSARIIRELRGIERGTWRKGQEDARKQSREVLHERRKQVICLHRKGMPVMQIVEYCGLSWYVVNTAITAYSIAGAAALKPGVRG